MRQDVGMDNRGRPVRSKEREREKWHHNFQLTGWPVFLFPWRAPALPALVPDPDHACCPCCMLREEKRREVREMGWPMEFDRSLLRWNTAFDHKTLIDRATFWDPKNVIVYTKEYIIILSSMQRFPVCSAPLSWVIRISFHIIDWFGKVVKLFVQLQQQKFKSKKLHSC